MMKKKMIKYSSNSVIILSLFTNAINYDKKQINVFVQTNSNSLIGYIESSFPNLLPSLIIYDTSKYLHILVLIGEILSLPWQRK